MGSAEVETVVVYAPLIVGITGKRDLKEKDDAVAKAFRELFELLDKEFSHTPKILLTALAAGADTIAAEVALDHADRQRKATPPGCTWQVVAVLPMPIAQYEEDFDAAGKAKLRDLCSRVRTDLLEPLHRPDPASRFAMGSPFAWAELARGNGNPNRTDHYEQVGLHISDQCGLLIAVMPGGEKPDKTGGTARILDYRVKAEPDPVRRDIARRSQVLAPLPLDRSQPGPAWVIDLDRLDPAKQTQLGAVDLWEPVIRREYEETHGANEANEATKHPVAIRTTSLTRKHRDFQRLWLASAIEAFNLKLTRWAGGKAGTVSGNGDASVILGELRHELSSVQGAEKRHLTKTVLRLASLFVFAILALEVHLKFNSTWAMAGYVVLFAVILSVYGYARWRRYQQHTEDYRAVAEALRVQLVWWAAGLSGRQHRVDRTYLGATGGSLGRVRTAVRHLIDSALLMAKAPTPAPGVAEKWIDGQIDYFTRRIRERHQSLSLVEDVSWFLFVGSFGIALFVAAFAAWEHETIAVVESVRWNLPGALFLVSALIAVGLFFTQRGLVSLARRATLSAQWRLSLKLSNVLIAVLAGLVVSAGLYDAAVLTSRCNWTLASHPEDFTHKLALIVMIGSVALAGAIRFYAEKMSQEHELFSYRDALVTFRRAQEELKELEGDGSPAAKDRRNEILVAIGKEALEENEAWIRAHRLRPLEPVVGG
jgi:hypothetical protein